LARLRIGLAGDFGLLRAATVMDFELMASSSPAAATVWA